VQFRAVMSGLLQKSRFYERFRQKTHKCVLVQNRIYVKRSKARGMTVAYD
jgi:hypothetical protein